MHYIHAIGGTLAEGKNYYVGSTDKFFVSPMKELNQKTELVEDEEENSNGSYRQHTKYNDKMDGYYSTYE